MMSVWHSDRVYEWICGEKRADELLNGGMRKINGQACVVEVVDRWPAINGITVRATTSGPHACR
jgi:hypothetical protein